MIDDAYWLSNENHFISDSLFLLLSFSLTWFIFVCTTNNNLFVQKSAPIQAISLAYSWWQCYQHMHKHNTRISRFMYSIFYVYPVI